MQFLFPGFLWALAVLAIPIILHLFYFRRYKKIYFSNVSFLREVKEETSARNKLRNLLILLMRCLALAFLVVAFAQPFVPVSENSGGPVRHVSIFVDNSFSMQSFGQDLPLLDRAKQRAADIIASHGDDVKFQILTHQLSGAQQRFLSKEASINNLEAVDIAPEVSQLSRIGQRQQRMLEQADAEGIKSYMLSDFQQSIVDDIPSDSAITWNLIPIQTVQERNVTIDSVWFETGVQMLNQTAKLAIRITNYSPDNIDNVKLTVTVDGQEKPVGTVSIPGGGSVIDTANITILRTGWHPTTVRISDFPVQFDDTHYVSFYVKEEVRILAVNGSAPNERLVAAFANNSSFNLDNANLSQLNYAEMRGYDLLILNEIGRISSGMTQELFGYLETGGRVQFFPAPNADANAYRDFLMRCGAHPFVEYSETERVVGSINTEDFIFEDVYQSTNRNLRLPVTNGSYTVNTIESRGGLPILTYRDGGAFIEKFQVGRGSLLVCNAPLDESVNTLSKNAEVFIPLLFRSSLDAGGDIPVAYIIGTPGLIEIQSMDYNSERVYTFKGDSEFIPGITPAGPKVLLDPADQVRTAGFYELFLGDSLQGVFAFNYSRTESDLAYYSESELAEQFGDRATIWTDVARAGFKQQIQRNEQGITFWRWCIILALLFLGLEILIIRLWKA